MKTWGVCSVSEVRLLQTSLRPRMKGGSCRFDRDLVTGHAPISAVYRYPFFCGHASACSQVIRALNKSLLIIKISTRQFFQATIYNLFGSVEALMSKSQETSRLAGLQYNALRAGVCSAVLAAAFAALDMVV